MKRAWGILGILLLVAVAAYATDVPGYLSFPRLSTPPYAVDKKGTIYFDGAHLQCADGHGDYVSFCNEGGVIPSTPTLANTGTPTPSPTATPTLGVGGCYDLAPIGDPDGVFICKNALGQDRLALSPSGVSDPTTLLVPNGILRFVVTDDSYARMGAWSASNTADVAPQFFGVRSRGTRAAPATTQDGDSLFVLFGAATDADGHPVANGTIQFLQSGACGSGFCPTKILIGTADGTGATHDGMILHPGGQVVLGGDALATGDSGLKVGSTLGFAASNGTISSDGELSVEYSSLRYVGAGADHTITGLLNDLVHANGDGQQIYLFNESAFSLTLANEDASATAENRFHFAGGADIVVPPDGVVAVMYDTSLSRWRDILSRPESGVAPAPTSTATITDTPTETGTPTSTPTITSTPVPTYTGLPCDACAPTHTETPTFTVTPTPTTPSCGGDPCTSSVDWTRLQTYPSACTSGSFITALGDTITCSQVPLTTGVTGVLPIANGGTNQSSTLTAGSVLFSNGTAVAQDNANLYWDDTNNRLGLCTTGPLATFHNNCGFASVSWADSNARNTQAYFRKDFSESDLPASLSALFGVDMNFTASANTALNVNAAFFSETIAGTKNYTGTHRGFVSQIASTGSGTLSATYTGAQGKFFTSSGSSATISGTVNGVEGILQHQGSGTLTKYVAHAATASSSTGTVTEYDGFAMSDGTGAGSFTNQIGVYIPNLTKGGTKNIGVSNGSRTTFPPPSAQNITAAATTLVATGTVLQLTANNSYTISNAPTLADGQEDGQFLIIVNVDTTDTITLQDQGTLASSNLRLSASTIALGPRDSIMLLYSSTVGDWVQIGQTNVL